MSKGVTQLVITHTDHGATNRYRTWAHEARKQARSANRNSIIAWWDDDEQFRKYHNNCGWTRQGVVDLQKERHQQKNIQLGRPNDRAYNLGRCATKVQDVTRDHPCTDDPTVWAAYE